MFEMAVDHVRHNTGFEIMGGYLSPVSDKYVKPGLISSYHRYEIDLAGPWRTLTYMAGSLCAALRQK